MSRPTTRLLALLELLQAHRLLSGAEIARRLRVDRRTVRRYIAALEDLGIPITTERGSAGGYQLVAGFKLPPMMFNEDEALALAVGLIAARGLALPQAAPAVASAQAKLERVMPAELRRRLRAVDETVAIDLAAATPPPDRAVLTQLATAAQARTRVALRYLTARQQETEREMDPYGLAHRRGRWYVVGMCHLRSGLRSFRIDRVRSVRPLGESFTRPSGFDVLAHLDWSLATLPRTFAVDVLLRTDLATARREIVPTTGLLEQTADGVRLRAQADSLRWLALELARLPFGFEIRRPAALRRAVRAHARRLLADHAVRERARWASPRRARARG